jgi:hypothetical protein
MRRSARLSHGADEAVALSPQCITVPANAQPKKCSPGSATDLAVQRFHVHNRLHPGHVQGLRAGHTEIGVATGVASFGRWRRRLDLSRPPRGISASARPPANPGFPAGPTSSGRPGGSPCPYGQTERYSWPICLSQKQLAPPLHRRLRNAGVNAPGKPARVIFKAGSEVRRPSRSRPRRRHGSGDGTRATTSSRCPHPGTRLTPPAWPPAPGARHPGASCSARRG